MRVNMFQTAKSLDDALSIIGDGCMLVVPREVSGVPMAATRALIRRGIKRLHLVALPTSSLQADLMIGAGCIETLETSAVSLGEFGPAPRFNAAILSGATRARDIRLARNPGRCGRPLRGGRRPVCRGRREEPG